MALGNLLKPILYDYEDKKHNQGNIGNFLKYKVKSAVNNHKIKRLKRKIGKIERKTNFEPLRERRDYNRVVSSTEYKTRLPFLTETSLNKLKDAGLIGKKNINKNLRGIEKANNTKYTKEYRSGGDVVSEYTVDAKEARKLYKSRYPELFKDYTEDMIEKQYKEEMPKSLVGKISFDINRIKRHLHRAGKNINNIDNTLYSDIKMHENYEKTAAKEMLKGTNRKSFNGHLTPRVVVNELKNVVETGGDFTRGGTNKYNIIKYNKEGYNYLYDNAIRENKAKGKIDNAYYRKLTRRLDRARSEGIQDK